MNHPLLSFTLLLASVNGMAQPPQPSPQAAQTAYKEKFRPRFHFSPAAHWMNDPNGMVFYQGVYHLFFQYYPGSTVWGPMHWGHAVSKDLVHWQEKPIALYPDSLGYIFSGSAVLDKNNTSGFGSPGHPPLVAIFTQHDPVGASRNRNDFQNQSIAYSTDNGRTWTKYGHNPVLKNPGITDFRDPKVFWYQPSRQWIMTLAAKDHVAFYASPDLKHWALAGEFGRDRGAHGGVWECPDLFPLTGHGQSSWVLIVNINPGGPNGGSATQYFLGSFDGTTFTPSTAGTRWLDYGPDEYAGVTWSNTGARRIFLGWMSNWLYGQAVPTSPWRSANTLPRELGLQKLGDSIYLTSEPVKELAALDLVTAPPHPATLPHTATLPELYRLDLVTTQPASFSMTFSNDTGDSTVIGYDRQAHQYYIDRRHSGISDFSTAFDGKFTAPRIPDSNPATAAEKINLILYADASSFELFADGGLTTMTALVFPSKPYTKLDIRSASGVTLGSFSLTPLKSIHN